MAQTVAGILVEALEQIGVTHIFGLIGDSLNALGDAVRRSKIQSVGVRHQEEGEDLPPEQAKLTGRLGVCAGRTGHGSNHLVAGLYEACRDHAPVLALSGDMPRKFHGTDYFQTSEPDLLFHRDVSLFTQTILAPDQAPAIIHQAIAAAYAGRGVAHLTLPQDVLVSKASDPCGYDAGKKIKGKKRHVLVDTQGLLMHAVIHAADIQDRDGGVLVMASLFGLYPFLLKLYADGGYQGPQFKAALQRVMRQVNLVIVKRSDAAKTFVVLPKRWIVEKESSAGSTAVAIGQGLGCLNHNARAFLRWASIRLMLRKLCR